MNFGWEATLVSAEDCVMLNVPVTGGSHQYVLNTKTNGWCRFLGWNSACYEVMSNELYFGAADGVYKAFSGTSDNGMSINGKVLQAFSKMGTENLKEFTMARPIISTDSNSLGVLVSLNVDYSTDEPTGAPTFTAGTDSTWDNDSWDDALWSGGLAVKKDWQTVNGVGTTGAMYLKTLSKNSQIKWASTEFIYMKGSGYY